MSKTAFVNTSVLRFRHEVIEVCGLKWAGFRHIPAIAGEWAGEVDGYELVELTQKLTAMDPQPDVLLTHCPPAGILSTDEYGNSWGNGHAGSILWFTLLHFLNLKICCSWFMTE